MNILCKNSCVFENKHFSFSLQSWCRGYSLCTADINTRRPLYKVYSSLFILYLYTLSTADINTRCPLYKVYSTSVYSSLFILYLYTLSTADINTRCHSAMSNWSETSSPFASRRRPASSLSALHEQSLVSAQQLHDLRLAAVSGNFCAKCLKSILYIYIYIELAKGEKVNFVMNKKHGPKPTVVGFGPATAWSETCCRIW